MLKSKTSGGIFWLMVAVMMSGLFTAACQSTTAPSTVNDTIRLISMQGDLNIFTKDSIWSADLELTCGCPFQLQLTAEGGDTSAFLISFDSLLTSKITPHTVRVSVKPEAPGIHLYSAWLAFAAVDHYNNTKYDTLRILGNLK